MNYGRRPLPSDDEGLQADVMRFMAIIAFCLIAIFALARNVEPEAATADSQVEEMMDREEVMDSQPLSPQPLRPQPLGRAPNDPHREAAPPAPERQAGPVQAETAVTPVQEVVAESPPPAPEGLSLRFASDRDFLRLVNRGQLEVFAFRDGDVKKLAPGLAFEPSGSPGQVHELLPDTIPALIWEVFAAAHADPSRYRWGIRMPAPMEAQIKRHLRTETRGTLVIDRYGDVHHDH